MSIKTIAEDKSDTYKSRVRVQHLTQSQRVHIMVEDNRAPAAYHTMDAADAVALAKQIVKALEPEPEPVIPEPGAKVRVKQGAHGAGLSREYVGKVYTVIPRPSGRNKDKYTIFVEAPDVGDSAYPLPLYADEFEVVEDTEEPVKAPRFAVGDRVVYTIPETWAGAPGSEAATKDEGSLGTVTNVLGSQAFSVQWDGGYESPHSPDFLAPAPKEPTHRYPEGLYLSQHTGQHVVIRHEAEPGSYAILYVDSTTADGDVPVNLGMNDVIVGSYTLVAAYSVK